MHNAHVIKWCRWHCWLAMQSKRQFAQLHWATQERIERQNEKRYKSEKVNHKPLKESVPIWIDEPYPCKGYEEKVILKFLNMQK